MFHLHWACIILVFCFTSLNLCHLDAFSRPIHDALMLIHPPSYACALKKCVGMWMPYMHVRIMNIIYATIFSLVSAWRYYGYGSDTVIRLDTVIRTYRRLLLTGVLVDIRTPIIRISIWVPPSCQASHLRFTNPHWYTELSKFVFPSWLWKNRHFTIKDSINRSLMAAGKSPISMISGNELIEYDSSFFYSHFFLFVLVRIYQKVHILFLFKKNKFYCFEDNENFPKENFTMNSYRSQFWSVSQKK